MSKTVFDACHLSMDQLLEHLATLEKDPEGFDDTKRVDNRTFECKIGSVFESIDTFEGCGSSIEDAKLIPLVICRLSEKATLEFKMKLIQRNSSITNATYFVDHWIATLKEGRRTYLAESADIGQAALAAYLLSMQVELEAN